MYLIRYTKVSISLFYLWKKTQNKEGNIFQSVLIYLSNSKGQGDMKQLQQCKIETKMLQTVFVEMTVIDFVDSTLILKKKKTKHKLWKVYQLLQNLSFLCIWFYN